MRYDLYNITDGEECESHICLSYESIIDIICEDILDGRFEDTVIGRRCCGSVSKCTLTKKEASEILALAKIQTDRDLKDVMRTILNNWYIKGTMSADNSDLPDML